MHYKYWQLRVLATHATDSMGRRVLESSIFDEISNNPRSKALWYYFNATSVSAFKFPIQPAHYRHKLLVLEISSKMNLTPTYTRHVTSSILLGSLQRILPPQTLPAEDATSRRYQLQSSNMTQSQSIIWSIHGPHWVGSILSASDTASIPLQLSSCSVGFRHYLNMLPNMKHVWLDLWCGSRRLSILQYFIATIRVSRLLSVKSANVRPRFELHLNTTRLSRHFR